MPRSGGAAILMQLGDKTLHFLVGNSDILNRMAEVKCLEVFNDDILLFLDELSSLFLQDRSLRKYSDVVSFAFWIRKRNLESLGKKYKGGQLKLGRGIAFHITPSNIPIQFAVSLVYGLLSGNINIIRISDRQFEEVDVICQSVNQLLSKQKFSHLREYMCIVRYGHNDELTRQLSSICDARIVWGGNATIDSIRRFIIPPRAVELCFADRDSICLIDADQYLAADHETLARDFYNDTFYVDQNACSSPRIVVWLGKRVSDAKKIFWDMLSKEVKNYEISPIAGSEKLLRFCVLAAKDREVSYTASDGVKIVRVEIKHLSEWLLDHKAGMGYFFEYTANNLEEILPLLRKSCQTVSYYGVSVEDIKAMIGKYGVRGVDRIVPMGHTQELSLKWDGVDIVETLSRTIYD